MGIFSGDLTQQFLLSITDHYWVLLIITEFYGVLLSITEHYWALLSYTEQYWVLLSITELYWALLSFTASCCLQRCLCGWSMLSLQWSGCQWCLREWSFLAMSLREASLHVACMSARYVCASVQGEGASLQINFPYAPLSSPLHPSSLSPPPSLTLPLTRHFSLLLFPDFPPLSPGWCSMGCVSTIWTSCPLFNTSTRHSIVLGSTVIYLSSIYGLSFQFYSSFLS